MALKVKEIKDEFMGTGRQFVIWSGYDKCFSLEIKKRQVLLTFLLFLLKISVYFKKIIKEIFTMAKTKSMSNEKLLQEILKSNDGTKRHFGVVAEGLEKQIGAIAEQHGTLVKNQEGIKNELEGVKLAVLDNGVAIKGNKTAIEDNKEGIKSVKSELGKINQKLDAKLENHEERISDIEHRVGIV